MGRARDIVAEMESRRRVGLVAWGHTVERRDRHSLVGVAMGTELLMAGELEMEQGGVKAAQQDSKGLDLEGVARVHEAVGHRMGSGAHLTEMHWDRH